MKKTKVKKIKKIPRYYDGSPAVLADFPMQLSTPGLKADAGAALKTMAGKAGLAIKSAAPSVAGAVGSVASPIAGALGIEQGLTGLVIGAIGSAVGMANPIAGAAIQVLGATAGGRAKLDKSAISTTSDIDDAVSHNTGWVGALFGADRDELLQKAAGIQNSKQSVELTSHAQEQWSNDPRNQRAVLNVKDGGVIPELVHAKVSKGELYYDPYNKTLSRVPGSPNKPNTDDDVDAFLARGGMVVTNNDEQPLINGKTQAIALAPMIDKPGKKMSEGTIAARDAIVRKTVRRNEMAKLNKPENRSKTLYAAKGDIVPSKWSFNLLENENQNNNSKPGNFDDFGMLDAYQWLSALVPLMDREKAEKVTLSRPTWKGIPVGVDVLKQLHDTQLGYDMSNYSITQGGYTAGQQLAARVAAADNLARQRAAIHAWQTQQQNENIAKNIASYNDHTRLLSEINDREADMNAANRGAARNINRQNRSQAFKNIGQILRDKKQYDMDLIRTEILKPMIESVYENSDVVIPMLNKQIKKKSTKKSKGE